MGPDACRTTELAGALRTLGQRVTDLGNITAATVPQVNLDHSAYGLEETIGWAQSLAAAAQTAMADGIPVFLRGDHALSLGSVAGVGRHAEAHGRPQFVLWLDAHSDFHTAQSSHSGNLHGTPQSYLTGAMDFPGFQCWTTRSQRLMFVWLGCDPWSMRLWHTARLWAMICVTLIERASPNR